MNQFNSREILVAASIVIAVSPIISLFVLWLGYNDILYTVNKTINLEIGN